MAREAYRGNRARCDCNLGGRVVSSGSGFWITPKWVVASTTFMGGLCGPRMVAVAAPWIVATNFVGWTMQLLLERSRTVSSSKSLACWVGFLRGVCDREVGVVRKSHQGGEEGVGRVGWVVPLDCAGRGQCHACPALGRG